MNGDILIRTVKEAASDAAPLGMGSVVVARSRAYVLRPTPTGAVTDTVTDIDIGEKENADGKPPRKVSASDTFDASAPFEVLGKQRGQLGEGDFSPALELALRHAKVGEQLEVRCSGKFGYGLSGRPASAVASSTEAGTRTTESAAAAAVAVPPNACLHYCVTVCALQQLHSLTLTPEEAADPAAVAANSALQGLELRREVGNRWYHCREYKRAARDYSRGSQLAQAYLSQPAPAAAAAAGSGSGSADEEERQQQRRQSVADKYVSCLNNLSACHISLGEYSQAKAVCVSILELDCTNVKALLRAARAALALHLYDECDACIVKVLQLEPNNQLARVERQRLRRAQGEYKQAQKDLARRMFTSARDRGSDKEEKADLMAAAEEEEEEEGRRGRPRQTEAELDAAAAKVEGEAQALVAATQKAAEEDSSSSNLLLLLLAAAVVLLAAVYIATPLQSASADTSADL